MIKFRYRKPEVAAGHYRVTVFMGHTGFTLANVGILTLDSTDWPLWLATFAHAEVEWEEETSALEVAG